MSSPAARRRYRQREEARRTILEATEALLLADGYEGFSMRRLAERCGYAAPTIYHYFGDKPGLLAALLEERFDDLLGAVRRVRRVEDPAQHVRALGRAYVEWGMSNPTFYRLLTLPRPEPATPPRSAEEARAVFEQPLDALSRAGRLLSEDVDAVKQTLWALLHGLVHLGLSRPDEPWSPRLLDVALDTVIRGSVRPSREAAERRYAW